MYLPFHIHTSIGSPLDGSIFCDKLAKQLEIYNIGSAMISDHGSMSGAIEFSNQLLKKKIKPIIANEMYFSHASATIKSDINRKLSHMVVTATSKKGYINLCQLTTRSNEDDLYYYKPRLSLDILSSLDISDLLFMTGHKGSLLHNVLESASPAEQLVVGERYLNRLIDIVGKENIYIEIQRVCCPDDDYSMLLTDIAKRTGIKTTACIDAHYVNREDAHNQRLLLASSLSTTLKKYKSKLQENGLISFFNHDYYHLPSIEEMKAVHTQQELINSMEISDRCEEYSLVGPPILPKFAENESQMLVELCDKGWTKILEEKNILNDDNRQEYKDRLNFELSVINEYGLSGYFLIVQDFIQYARSLNSLVIARGSAGSSLVSYLCGITNTDPIPNKLLFSRFLNKGRFTKDNIEYPDIDVDFAPHIREKVIEYIKDKYGHKNVAQICNFSTLKGAGALKEVLRMHEAASYLEMNEITKHIPNEAAISDQLEEQNESSILMFTLKNYPATVAEYCRLENGELVGDYAEYFKQAIEIEGNIKSQGIHAAGLIIAPVPLGTLCPMSRANSGNLVCAYDMQALKKTGIIKFDLLSTQVISKLMYVNQILG